MKRAAVTDVRRIARTIASQGSPFTYTYESHRERIAALGYDPAQPVGIQPLAAVVMDLLPPEFRFGAVCEKVAQRDTGSEAIR